MKRKNKHDHKPVNHEQISVDLGSEGQVDTSDHFQGRRNVFEFKTNMNNIELADQNPLDDSD